METLGAAFPEWPPSTNALLLAAAWRGLAFARVDATRRSGCRPLGIRRCPPQPAAEWDYDLALAELWTVETQEGDIRGCQHLIRRKRMRRYRDATRAFADAVEKDRRERLARASRAKGVWANVMMEHPEFRRPSSVQSSTRATVEMKVGTAPWAVRESHADGRYTWFTVDGTEGGAQAFCRAAAIVEPGQGRDHADGWKQVRPRHCPLMTGAGDRLARLSKDLGTIDKVMVATAVKAVSGP